MSVDFKLVKVNVEPGACVKVMLVTRHIGRKCHFLLMLDFYLKSCGATISKES